jgi:hypothetical protein
VDITVWPTARLHITVVSSLLYLARAANNRPGAHHIRASVVVFLTGSAAHRGNRCLPLIGPIQFLYVPHSTFSAAHREEFILVLLNFDPKQTVT